MVYYNNKYKRTEAQNSNVFAKTDVQIDGNTDFQQYDSLDTLILLDTIFKFQWEKSALMNCLDNKKVQSPHKL